MFAHPCPVRASVRSLTSYSNHVTADFYAPAMGGPIMLNQRVSSPHSPQNKIFMSGAHLSKVDRVSIRTVSLETCRDLGGREPSFQRQTQLAHGSHLDTTVYEGIICLRLSFARFY